MRIEHERTASMNHTLHIITRRNAVGPNHHLWDNHGIWWFQATVHLGDGTAERVRISLRTKCVETARRRRDAILQRHASSAA